MKDTYTHGHSERTAKVAVELGARMGLPADRLRVIARGAYLHDLGKIGISDEILNKPGALDAAERRIMETHPRLGYELASGAPTLREALPVILHHHERVDGGGYPEGLRGREIPLEARVVAVADVWDALTSDRAYRPGWEPARALAHIEAGRGTPLRPEGGRRLRRARRRLGHRAVRRAGRGRGGLERGPDLPRGGARGRARRRLGTDGATRPAIGAGRRLSTVGGLGEVRVVAVPDLVGVRALAVPEHVEEVVVLEVPDEEDLAGADVA